MPEKSSIFEKTYKDYLTRICNLNLKEFEDKLGIQVSEGKAIILSTHRMNEIEELCDRVFMINKGRGVLYGELAEIKSRFRRNSVFLEYEGQLTELAGVTRRNDRQGSTELVLDESVTPQEILEKLIAMGVSVNRYEVSTPPLNDIFLQVVGEKDE